MSLELNYKAKNVANAERSFGMQMFEEINKLIAGPIGVYQLAFFLCAGGYDEEAAYDIIDKSSVSILQNEVIEALFTADFLAGGDEATKQKIHKAVEDTKRELVSSAASPNTGEAKKPKPTK